MAVLYILNGRGIGFDSLTTSAALKRISTYEDRLTEQSKCLVSLFVSEGKATNIQIQVSLGLVFDDLIPEGDIIVINKSDGLFDVQVEHCTDELLYALSSEPIQRSWRSRISNMRAGTHIIIAHVQRKQIKLTGGSQKRSTPK
tara:strand:+ start:364 stop:792 length:429 start_codon:yes stop_codon:yes gene_type:complete